jgi:C1A family cysteine protease
MGLYYSTEASYNKYGWKPDLPDNRDNKLYFQEIPKHKIPNSIDLRKGCPPIYNQGKLGSCTANAISFAYEFDQIRQKETETFVPSRLFIYYNEREKEESTLYDSGASIRDGIKSINRVGVCKESTWPYDIARFTEKPPIEAYNEAKEHKSVKYSRVTRSKTQIKHALQSGFPVVFGIAVYESFESDEVTETGIVPRPKPEERQLGGHAIALVGYDEKKQWFIFRNSWGTKWGDDGYGYIPYTYVLDKGLSNDFWVVESVRDVE